MSKTIIFKFNKEGNAMEYKSVENSWRGSPAIWNILEEKYLPMHIPNYIRGCNWYYEGMPNEEIIDKCGYKPTRFSDMFHPDAMREIWDLVNKDNVSAIDKICLFTTFDGIVVRKEYLPTVIWAFRNFKGETSLPEQANILEELMEDEDCVAVAWHQNDISCNMWYPKYDDDDNKIDANLSKVKKEYFIFENENLSELLGREKQI